ncbi:MAG TPA: MFS transporter [Candidatus Stackebrandtia excrementipullorum]|nr:MFS transporter [Candidatus Stackebrandtia excrementipullorum]
MAEKPQLHTDDERPATYREVFASTEIRALFGSFGLSKASSMLARVAVASLVWHATSSPLLSAAAFGISYLPYLGPAQLLATLADRLPYRSTMVFADLVRMVLIGLVAIPGMPLSVMLVLVFLSAMVEPAYQAARSALLPKLVAGEVLTLALSIYLTVNQTAQLTGYFLGGIIAGVNPRLALLINAAAFAVSAVALVLFVKPRPADSDRSRRKNLLRETGEGFTMVFGNQVLRIIALVVFTTVVFTIIPEGVAVPWTNELGGGPLLLALIMAAAPVAAITSTIVFTRILKPALRQKLIRPLVLLAPLSLVATLFDPSGPWIVVIAFVGNLSLASLTPLNATFVQAVPDGYRARTFSVMQSGMALLQGGAIIAAGALAQTSLTVSQSVGLWGLGGTVTVLILLWRWPSSRAFDDAVGRDPSETTVSTQSKVSPGNPETSSS